MPRYEMMYILASSVSDDLIPETTAQVEQFVTDFGGTDVSHTQLGKKKLAYPIKKTRNGHYGVINFTMDTSKVNPLDAKIRTQGNTIIRHIIVNIDEHLERLEKDREVQAKMNRNRPADKIAEDTRNIESSQAPIAEAKPAPSPASEKREAKKVSTESLDDEIEKALNEDITK